MSLWDGAADTIRDRERAAALLAASTPAVRPGHKLRHRETGVDVIVVGIGEGTTFAGWLLVVWQASPAGGTGKWDKTWEPAADFNPNPF